MSTRKAAKKPVKKSTKKPARNTCGIRPKTAAKTDRKAPTAGGIKRTEEERARDLPEIARLYLRGMSQREIAETLSAGRPYTLSRVTITHDLTDIRAEWLEEATSNYDQHVARELARIDKLEFTYWDAWERSCKEETTKGGKTVTQPAAKAGAAPVVTRQEGTVKTKTLLGDPAFLRGVENCIKLRMDLLGLAAPDVHLLGGLRGDTGRQVRFTLDLGKTLTPEGADA